MKTRPKTIIGVVGIGHVPKTVLNVIAAHVSGYLNLGTEILSPLGSPVYAFDSQRCQYDAAKILLQLEAMPPDDYEKVIGVLTEDLFVPIFTHVYGEARQGGKYGLVSLYRLREKSLGSSPPSRLVLERAAKVALHELGHLYDQTHCEDQRCLMHFAGSLEDLDHSPFYLCRYCASSLNYRAGRVDH